MYNRKKKHTKYKIKNNAAENQELEEEAEWIFKFAFLEQPISQQDDQYNMDMKQPTKPHSTIGKIQEALNLMRNDLFEVNATQQTTNYL